MCLKNLGSVSHMSRNCAPIGRPTGTADVDWPRGSQIGRAGVRNVRRKRVHMSTGRSMDGTRAECSILTEHWRAECKHANIQLRVSTVSSFGPSFGPITAKPNIGSATRSTAVDACKCGHVVRVYSATRSMLYTGVQYAYFSYLCM